MQISQKKRKNIVFMGDSITEGQFVGAPLRWVDIVGNSFVNKAGHNAQFFHSGVSGDTTRQGLERFPKGVQILHPDTVFIQFGHNDCNYWDTDNGSPRVSLNAFVENLNEMHHRCTLSGAEHIYFIAPHPTLLELKSVVGISYEDSRASYEKAMMNVASDLNCPMVQPSKVFGEHRLNELLLDDKIHLSELGHKVYAGILMDFLTSNLGDEY